MIVFDAGVLIAHLDAEDAHHAAAEAFLEENEEFDFAASALTIAECLVRPVLAGRVTTVLAAFERLHLLQLDLPASDAAGIAEVRGATGLRMPDAIVVHAAERHGAALATTDAAVARAARSRGIIAHLVARADVGRPG